MPQQDQMATTSDKKNIVTNPPSYLEYKAGKPTIRYQFLIMDAPTDANIAHYVKAMKAKNVTTVCRACEPSYSTSRLSNNNIEIEEMPFSDGSPPSDEIITRWLDVVAREAGNSSTVAVHCVAGLGRAPVLVAIALMELADVECLDAIQLIRRVRRGAINQRQLKYLRDYVVRSSDGCSCTIL